MGLAALSLAGGYAIAADHAEAPGTQADSAADIADFYIWHTDDAKIVAAMTFAGLGAAGDPATYDADVLYTINIDNDGDNVADLEVHVRFGQNTAGDWGVEVLNLPGTNDPVDPDVCGGAGHCGPVDTVIDTGGAKVYAGLREDPFFFDLEGYLATLQTGTVSFDATNDSFAGLNVTAIVIEMDAAAVANGATDIQAWATSARK